MSESCSGEALRHISYWARANRLGGIFLDPSLLEALDLADRGEQLVDVDREAAEQLLQLDIEAHGYGTGRALRSDRQCGHCAEVGRVLEALIPRLHVRRSKTSA